MSNQVKVAIDLLWVRPKQIGGIESYIRNLLDGFMELEDNFEFWLLVSQDNAETFKKYKLDKRFHLEKCKLVSSRIVRRIIWQNFHLGKKIRTLGINVCFEPYYCKPFFGTTGIKFMTTIHDLQALHYPEYFSWGKVIWMRFSWWNTIRTSQKVISISSFVREDILKHYKVTPNKIIVLYNPIAINVKEIKPVEYIERKYDIKAEEFFFSVSSLLPHKNINILLDIMKKIEDENLPLPRQLIVSGIGGKSKKKLEKKIKEYQLEKKIRFTPFIDNDERNALYKYSKIFLFPSTFEGFGMPPVEAMIFGTPVVTTRKASLEEVTQGKAIYVEDPYNVTEWISKIQDCKFNALNYSVYDKKNIAKEYLNNLSSI